MQVATDALAVVDDRQPRLRRVQPGIVDGDSGVQREHLDQPLVLLAEFRSTALVRQVQVADRYPSHRDRYAEQAVHLGVVRRKAVPALIGGHVRQPH